MGRERVKQGQVLVLVAAGAVVVEVVMVNFVHSRPRYQRK
jgi:hypothetical protein